MPTAHDLEGYYQHIDEVFSRAAVIYDWKIQANFVNRSIRSVEISTLLKYSRPGMSVLELGHGTGEEALKYIKETGNHVTGIDVAHGMAEFARDKIARNGLGHLFQSNVIPASRMGELGETFDIVYSFNGLINTEPDMERLIDGLLKITHRGSFFIVSFRNTSCFGETIISMSGRGRRAVRARKANEVNVEVVGEKVASRYYSSFEIRKILGKNFRIRETLGLAVLFPPYLADKLSQRHLSSLISFADRLMGRLPVLNCLGDEVLIVAERI